MENGAFMVFYLQLKLKNRWPGDQVTYLSSSSDSKVMSLSSPSAVVKPPFVCSAGPWCAVVLISLFVVFMAHGRSCSSSLESQRGSSRPAVSGNTFTASLCVHVPPHPGLTPRHTHTLWADPPHPVPTACVLSRPRPAPHPVQGR